ncbi:hypothetical protein [Chitinophaga varians]|uniref:hypothetical protein n=1 Tax=Chitinophaga varians TaxID=2202339 RepID=UPI00165F2349|nr:hypothetical protein [Chitinophaga varians]MBC9913909.1 hypothetical protein [Chitinophaga varians]
MPVIDKHKYTKGTTYPWKNLANTFIVQRIQGKSLLSFLVLITPAQQHQYIEVSAMSLNGIPRLATAIDHFSKISGKTV